PPPPKLDHPRIPAAQRTPRGLRTPDAPPRHEAPRPHPILDHEALAEEPRQSVGDEPAGDVGGSACGRRDDEADGTLRIRLSGGVERSAEERPDRRERCD